VRADVDRLRAVKAVPEVVVQRQRMLAERAQDRSNGVLLASVALALPPSAKLTALVIDADQKVSVEGVFAPDPRRSAVEMFAALDGHLRALAGVRLSGGNVEPPDAHGIAKFQSWASPQEKP
jgi:hypothetical protein